MITRLKLFRNIGKFDSTSTTTPLSRLQVIYAENGRGKTTLAAIFRSLATGSAEGINERHRLTATQPPEVIIEAIGGPPNAMFGNGAWNRTLPQMVIFDDNFVDGNVCSGLVVQSLMKC
jgi:wobble nucleotide-excising tRNase